MAHPGPQFSVHDVYVGWVEALRELGQHVVEFDLASRLTFYDSALLEAGAAGDTVAVRKALTPEQAVELAVNGLYATLYKVRPDVLLVVSAFMIPPDLMDLARRYGTQVVVVHTESPYEDQRQLQVAPHADLNLLNDPTNIDRYPAGTVYMPHAYRPSVHHPGEPKPDLVCDLAFVGTGYESRIEFFEAMDLAGLDVLLAGNWQQLTPDSPLLGYVTHDPAECLDNAQTADVYRSARVGINLYRREAERPELSHGWAMGPREVEMAACGLFYLRDPRPEGDEVLPMLPTFTTPAEASDLLRWWLAHPDERAEAAGKAQAAVADRTFTANAARLLRLLDKE